MRSRRRRAGRVVRRRRLLRIRVILPISTIGSPANNLHRPARRRQVRSRRQVRRRIQASRAASIEIGRIRRITVDRVRYLNGLIPERRLR